MIYVSIEYVMAQVFSVDAQSLLWNVTNWGMDIFQLVRLWMSVRSQARVRCLDVMSQESTYTHTHTRAHNFGGSQAYRL